MNIDKIKKGVELMKDSRKQLERTMNSKDYLITVYECGDEVMSEGDVDRQVLPRRYWEVVSLTELRKRLETIYRGFWTHPDLKEDFSNEKEIPFEEKKFGVVSNIIVSPLSKKLEERYVRLSQANFFHHKRMGLGVRKEVSNDAR